MLLDLMRAWELDAARCVLVGDQDTDMAGGAAAAGINGLRFHGRQSGSTSSARS